MDGSASCVRREGVEPWIGNGGQAPGGGLGPPSSHISGRPVVFYYEYCWVKQGRSCTHVQSDQGGVIKVPRSQPLLHKSGITVDVEQSPYRSSIWTSQEMCSYSHACCVLSCLCAKQHTCQLVVVSTVNNLTVCMRVVVIGLN